MENNKTLKIGKDIFEKIMTGTEIYNYKNLNHHGLVKFYWPNLIKNGEINVGKTLHEFYNNDLQEGEQLSIYK